MNSSSISLDLTLLENVKEVAKGIQARCPACAEEGSDRTDRNHLLIYPNGAFHCAKYGRDEEHNRRIHKLVGSKDTQTFSRRDREEYCWRVRRQAEARWKKEKLNSDAKAFLPRIRESFAWDPCDVWEDSPQRIDCDLVERDSRHFMATLFNPEDILWTGEIWQSGPEHGRGRWKCVRDWLDDPDEIGPMITPSVWKPEIISRCSAGVAQSPYTVLDFDEINGRQPLTDEEREDLIAHALAVTRWMRDELEADLAAILHTGNKSLHVWIRTPNQIVLKSIRDSARALGLDAGLIGAPEHPARLPGQLHPKSQKRSKVLWLKNPAET